MPSPKNRKNKKNGQKKRKKQSTSDIDSSTHSSTGELHGETGLQKRPKRKRTKKNKKDKEDNKDNKQNKEDNKQSDQDEQQSKNKNTENIGNKQNNELSLSETIAEGNRTLYEFDSGSFLSQTYTDSYATYTQMSSTPLNNTYPSSASSPSFINPAQNFQLISNQQQIPNPMAQYQIPAPQYYAPQSPDNPPKWAINMMDQIKHINEDVKNIKHTVTKIENIEKTVNMINMKVTDLETKVTCIDNRVKETETACSFISDQHEKHKQDLDTAKAKIESLSLHCNTLNKTINSLQDEKSNLNAKIVDLEARSMQENLIFYGIKEEENENCEQLIKQLCVDKLNIDESPTYKIDRAHRMGPNHARKPRPIVVKFHSFKDRETVRQKSFQEDISKSLKDAGQGVGVQWPKQIRDTRKDLRPIMIRERENGKTVRMVKDKLYVNNKLVNIADYNHENGMEH